MYHKSVRMSNAILHSHATPTWFFNHILHVDNEETVLFVQTDIYDELLINKHD
jgi:hypothetical protein